VLALAKGYAAGGWKQLGALPVPRLMVYLVKFAVVMAAIAAMQALLVAGVRLDGLIDHATVPMPWRTMAVSAVSGWAACTPLAALQLWVGTLWESFGAQFAVSTILTVPGMTAIHRLNYAMWDPWSQPAMVMFGQTRGAERPPSWSPRSPCVFWWAPVTSCAGTLPPNRSPSPPSWPAHGGPQGGPADRSAVKERLAALPYL
jgi:hypothetical protein